MVYGKWHPSRFGARVAAGGADYTGGVGAAGTVARIDLRVLRPPTRIKPPLLPTVRPLRSLPGLRPLSLRINTLATRRPLPYARRPSSTAPVRCVRPGHQQRALNFLRRARGYKNVVALITPLPEAACVNGL